MYLADKLGFSIKLLGIATQIETRDGTPAVIQRVHPALVDKNTALGGTHGVLNGLFTLGDFVGPVFSQVIRTIIIMNSSSPRRTQSTGRPGPLRYASRHHPLCGLTPLSRRGRARGARRPPPRASPT